MTKGQIREIIRSAIYLNKIDDYSVKYRELHEYITKPLREFLEAGDEYAGIESNAIPWHRIIEIYEHDKIIFTRAKK